MSRRLLAPLGLGPLLAACVAAGPPPPPSPVPPPPSDEACVRQCVEFNQRRAISILVIHAECEAECRDGPSAPQ